MLTCIGCLRRHPLLDFSFKSLARWAIIATIDNAISLNCRASDLIMGVFIAGTVPQLFGTSIMAVAQSRRNRQDAVRSDIVQCRVNGLDGSIGFWGRRDIDHGLRQRDSAFGHTDGFHSLSSGCCD